MLEITTSQRSFPAIWWETTNPQKTFRHQRLNHLTSINVDFVRPEDSNFNLVWKISAETTAKISWGLITPC
jgi:hypothetical protein